MRMFVRYNFTYAWFAESLLMALNFDDDAGLFSMSSPNKRKKPDDNDEGPNGKRIKLRRWDTVAAQGLNPYGASPIEKAPLGELWNAVKSGNKAVEYYSELAATDETGGIYRIGVGLSRTAESMVSAIQRLQEPKYKKLLDKDLYKNAIDEAEKLLPILQIINAGKGVQGGELPQGFAGLRRMQNQDTTPMPSPEARKKAASAFYDYLKKETTPLRGMLSLLSAGGTFYAGAVAEKTARAWVAANDIKVSSLEAAVHARARNIAAPVAAEQDDSAGLIK